MPPPERYNTNYNLGVGGAVIKDGKLLMVRRASRRGRGNWQIPGGFVEQDETMEQAVVREVEEESGVTAEVVGVLGIRNRYDPDNGNSTYVILALRPVSGEPVPDNHEVGHGRLLLTGRNRCPGAGSAHQPGGSPPRPGRRPPHPGPPGSDPAHGPDLHPVHRVGVGGGQDIAPSL